LSTAATQLEGVALVTGAASGIGRATARLMAERGASGLVLLDRDQAGLAALAGELPCRTLIRAHDVADDSAWAATVEAVRSEFGNIRYAVVNAGVGEGAPIAASTLAEWKKVLAVNLDGAFLTLQAGFRLMGEGGGAMVVTSSVMAFRAEPGTAAYGASKAGALQLARVAAKEGAPLGIRVNAVCPGGVDTAIWEKQEWFGRLVANRGGREGAIAALASNTPLGRFAAPEEVAAQIVHLLSPASGFVTGTHILIDGGLQL
jgi:NAD(P)-dependent dehydrogenase (short-subunit alcohol dehydrogenase family)